MTHLVLTALDSALADAWQRHCGRYAFVSVERRSILDVQADAVVSPANSFGFMDGGIDLAYSEFFGWDVERSVQSLIRSDHNGELPVGLADIVLTGHARFPYLIVAPTMRVPNALMSSPNPYLAARAALLLLLKGTFRRGRNQGESIAAHVRRVAFPGLGTGKGELPAETCARQFAAAIESVMIGSVPYPRSLAQAQERHYELIRP